MQNPKVTQDTVFRDHVAEGLAAAPRFLSSRYFYDKKGDSLFQRIMAMPEYYLTNSEMEIFTEQATAIVTAFGMNPKKSFELVELGAGDGTKTIKLLAELKKQDYNFSYLPVDISQNALSILETALSKQLPDLSIIPQQGEYFTILRELLTSDQPKVILFIGSNLGNMTDSMANDFLTSLGSYLKKEDKVLLGLDLIKSAEIVLPAYNDAAGITRDFNLNLLTRINRELDGDFKIENFSHQPEYSEKTGITKSFIRSDIAQTVTIGALGQSFEFASGELIHTEISRKYNQAVLNEVLSGTGLSIVDKFTDQKGYFTDFLLEKL